MDINTSLHAKYLGKGKRTVVGIVLHDTAGSGTHNDTKYLASPGDGRKVSVDFTVERDGSVWQLNPDLKNNWTFHAGRATSFKGLKNAAVTKGCIGIEIVQKATLSLDPLYPFEQVNAVAELCAKLCVDFKLTKADVTTHKQIITDGSRSDPRKFPWEQFWNRFNEYIVEFGGKKTPGKEITHIVSKGDTLWGLSVKYQVPVEEIKRLSGIVTASTLIEVGQKLIIKQ